jgi:DnaK suppressor protein
MNPNDLEKYQKKLEELISDIESYLKNSVDSAVAVEPDKGLGRLSRMEAMQDQQMVLELRRRKKRQLLEVKNALKRIDQEVYGSCLFCAKTISIDRLDAFPEVQTCVNCA